ncbi:MAG: ABC transporter permease, partial [Bacteroidota bacterium]
MFSHLLKLMWNKRRANGMIFLEILLAFIVLFGVYAFLAYNLERYNSPLGFSYEHSIGVRVDLKDDLDSLSVMQLQQSIRRDLLDIPQVAAASWIGQVNPFGGSTWTTGNEINGQEVRTQMMFVDEHFQETAEIKLKDGRWFTEDDFRAKFPPLVVNEEFKRRYYPNVESIVDSVFGSSGQHRIVGMTGD